MRDRKISTRFFKRMSKEKTTQQHSPGPREFYVEHKTKYEVCSKNTRTEVIKNVLRLEVTCVGRLQSTLFSNAHTYPNGVSTS